MLTSIWKTSSMDSIDTNFIYERPLKLNTRTKTYDKTLTRFSIEIFKYIRSIYSG